MVLQRCFARNGADGVRLGWGSLYILGTVGSRVHSQGTGGSIEVAMPMSMIVCIQSSMRPITDG